MANCTLKTNSEGYQYYEIRVRRGRGLPTLSTTWYVPDGWSKRAIDRELEKVAAEFERKAKAGEIISRKEQKELAALAEAEAAKICTFQQYAEKVYLPALKITASKHTIDNFERNLKNHIYPRLGQMKITDITTADITALLLAEQSSGNMAAPKKAQNRKNTKTQKKETDQNTGLKISSVTKLYCILRLIFKKAYLEDMISKNPMDKVIKPKATKAEGKEAKNVEFYTEEELIRIMDLIEQEPLQWRTYIRLLIDTGCRRGEACGLRWCDVDFEDNCVVFAPTLAYTPEAGIYLDTPKNGKARKVYIDPEITELLKKLKKSQKVTTFDKKGYVFTQSEDSSLPMHPDTPTRYFKNFGDRYHMNRFHPHKLRHSFVSIALTNGADPVSVSQKVGHSDVAVTLRVYSHASDNSQKRANDIFRSALMKSRSKDDPKTYTGN